MKKLDDSRWAEWAEDKLVWEWLKVEPSLCGVNLAPYFWIARDSLKNSVPIENLVSNSVRLLCQNLLHKQSINVMRKFIQEEMGKFDERERQMLILFSISSPLKFAPTVMFKTVTSSCLTGRS